jgi:hypothetical protein
VIAFAIFFLCVLAVIGLLMAGGGDRPGRRKATVRKLPAKKVGAGLRVNRGQLDRKDLYYDPKQFRRPRR